MTRLAQRLFVWLVLAIGIMSAAVAADFPSRPIHIVVPFAPGGLVDPVARAVASPLTEAIGQPVIVENKPGGSGIIGMLACAKAPPDGYTLCMAVADAISYNPYVIQDLPYDPANDFVPVIYLVRGNSALWVRGSAPFNSLKEMMAFAKSKPGVLNWGTWGPASIPDVYLQWIKYVTGVNITAIPNKGSAPTIREMLAGRVDITFVSIGQVLAHHRSGKVKPLAMISDKRSPYLPDTPTLNEEGLDPGLRSYLGVFAPAGTPKPIVDRLNAEFARAMEAPRVQEFFRAQILDVVGGSAADFAEFLKNDRAIAGRVFRTIGVRPSKR